MQSFSDAINERVLVCDGAMGTMLYAEGVFVNRSFDALNVSDPDLVERIHRAYRDAGADVLETNTFGANRPSRLLKNTRIGLFSWPSCVSRPPRQRCARGHAVPTRGPATPAAGDQGHLASRFRNRTKL